jgi:hypothetical protein
MLKVAAGALLMLAVLVGVARYAAGALVASEGFRETAARQLEKGLRPFIPQALVAVEESELSGFGEVVLRRMSVRSEQKIDASVAIPELRVRPHWLTLLMPGRTELEANARLNGDGNARLVLSVPLKVMIRGAGDADAELDGSFERADAPTVLALALASGHGRAPRFAKGLFDGEIAIKKGVGADRNTSRKLGHATLRFYEAAYALKDGREEKLSPFEAVLDLRDYAVKIAEPFLVETAAHDARALVGGGFLLPRHADQNVGWDLDVTADGRPGFKDDLAQVFRCQTAPDSPRFKIVGPVADARCQAIVAASAKKGTNGLR